MTYYYSPFRRDYSLKNKGQDGACPFCEFALLERQAIRKADGRPVENEHYAWLVNYYPKFEGHTLIIPKRHFTSLDDETDSESVSRANLIRRAVGILMQVYVGAGAEVFLQYGPGSAATVSHLHWHVVPAMPDDPFRAHEKLGQYYTTEEGKGKTVIFPITIKYARMDLQKVLSQFIGKADHH